MARVALLRVDRVVLGAIAVPEALAALAESADPVALVAREARGRGPKGD